MRLGTGPPQPIENPLPNTNEEECKVKIRPVFEADDFSAAMTPELRVQEARMSGSKESRNRRSGWRDFGRPW